MFTGIIETVGTVKRTRRKVRLARDRGAADP